MHEEKIFRAVLLLTLVPGMVILLYHRIKAATGEKISRREEGAWIGIPLRLFGLVTWLGLSAYLIDPGWMMWSRLELPAWLRWLGSALVAASLPLIYWVASSLGRNITDTVVTRAQHTLVTDGPYRWVRHPLYAVAFLLLVSISLVAANWFFALTSLSAFTLLALRTAKEEQKLIERFGDQYRDYMQKTGRFIPRLRTQLQDL